MDEEGEKDFPRGGAPALTPLEARKIRSLAKKEVLFGENVEPSKKKKKKISKVSSLTESKESTAIKAKKTSVDHFSFKYLMKGIIVLGYVKQINLKEIVIGLPNGLNGYLKTEDIQMLLNQLGVESGDESDSDEEKSRTAKISDVFSVGQLLPLVVKDLFSNLTGFKKIKLSALPSDVNENLIKSIIKKDMLLWGMVSRQEDHGFSISLGKDGFSCFLPRGQTENPESLKIGMTKWLRVTNPNKKIFTVTDHSEEVKKAMVSSDDIHFNNLFPGQLVKCTLEEKVEGCIIGKIASSFEIIIEQLHLSNIEDEIDNFEKKKKTGRIIHINPKTKQIGVSILPDLVKMPNDIIDTSFQTGDVLENCEVLQKSNVFGLLLKMSNGKLGNVHISRVSDDHVEKLGKKYGTGTTHKCRVFGYSALDSVYTLSMKKSDIEKKFLSYNDIEPGMVVPCTVITLESFGVIVKIADHIQGLCPTMHLADIPLKNPSKKFVKDKNIICRVLKVQPEQKKLQLTHKKTLVSSELPVIASYKDAKVGDIVHGFVLSIKPYGLVLSFYNDVRALMLKSGVLIPEGSTLNEAFYVGKVVQCRILSVDPENKKMSVSMKNVASGSAAVDELPIEKTIDTASFVSLSNKEVELKSKKGNMKLSLPKAHLSDFVGLTEDWMEFLMGVKTLSAEFKNLILFEKNKKEEKNFVSHKKIFGNGLDNLVFDDLKVGMIHYGIVANVMDFGVFVELSKGVKGLAPTSNLTDRFEPNPSHLFSVGQSVIAKVTDIDVDKKRFVVSLKPASLVSATEEDEILSKFNHKHLLKQYLTERKELYNFINKSNDETSKLLVSVEKEVILAKVTSVTKEGVHLKYTGENGVEIDGFITKDSKHEGDFESGETVQCLVVFVEISKKRFIATCHKDAIDDLIKLKEKPENIKLSSKKQLNTVVCYSNEDLAVVLLTDHHHTIAYMPVKLHLNDVKPSCNVSINHAINAQFESSSDVGIIVINLDQTMDVSDPKDITVGTMVNAVVKGIKPNQLNVSLCNGKLRGRIHISNVLDEIEEGICPLKDFTPTQIVTAKLIGFRDIKTHNYLAVTNTHKTQCFAELSLKPSDKRDDNSVTTEEYKLTDYKKGDIVTSFVTVLTKYDIQTSVGSNIKGKIPILLSSNNVEDYKKMRNRYKIGQALKSEVTEVDEKRKQLVLSRIGDPAKLVKKGSNVIGRVSKVLKNGLLIELPNHKAGLAHVTELNDVYVESPLEERSEGDILKCQILSIDAKTDHIDLSLRNSRLLHQESVAEGVDKIINGFDDIKEGDILRGYVKSCTKVGVFVSLSPSIAGRVQIKNLSQYFVKDYFSLFPNGKLVKAKILSINPTNNNIDLSMRGKDVHDTDPAPPPPKRKKKDEGGEGDTEEGASPTKKRKIFDTSIDDGEDGGEKSGSDEEKSEDVDEDEEMDADEEGSDDEEEQEAKKDTGKPSLELGGAFDWTMEEKKNQSSDSEDSEDNEDDDKKSAKKSKRQKRAAKKAEEEALHKAELALLDTERQLESAEDFDRIVLGSPNSSIIWIQYMAFHLHAAEVEKAMAVGRRALKTISFREEREKLNIWVALLNLENSYGTKESLEKLFQEAVKVNEPIKVYIKMVELYIKNDKNEEAEKLYQVMLKRFRQHKKIWVGYAFFLMKIGKMEQSRSLLQRSLKSLPERKHVSTIVKFAIMEFKMGEPQRGATIFESLLKNYPRKTDIWSIYVDMWIKQGDYDQVRNIFERVTTLNLSTKKMKFLFKRYVNFEEENGTKTTVENARSKAAEYIDRHLFDDEADDV